MKVSVIRQKGQAVLVQWEDAGVLHRAQIPPHALDGDEVNPTELLMGIPYGLPWAEIMGDLIISGEEIEYELRRHGIWTLEDLQSDPTSAAGALMAAHRQGVRTLIQRAMNARIQTAPEPEGSEEIGGSDE